MYARTERKKRDRRERIRRAAFDLFMRQGFDATTVDAIAGRADVAKGTFFNYYPTKQSVLVEYYLVLASDFLLLARRARGTTARARLQSFFRAVEERLSREGDLLEVLFREVFARPELLALDAETEEAVLEIYRSRIRDGVASGELRADLDVMLTATTVIDLWSATLRAWLGSGRSFSLAAVLNKKLELLFDGLRAPAAGPKASKERS